MTSSCRRFRAGVISLYTLAYLLRNAEIPDPRAPRLGRLSLTSRPKGPPATAIWLQHSRESDLLLRPLIPAFLATKENRNLHRAHFRLTFTAPPFFARPLSLPAPPAAPSPPFFAWPLSSPAPSCCSICAFFRLAAGAHAKSALDQPGYTSDCKRALARGP